MQNICSIIRKPIEKALIEKLQIEIVDSMKIESSYFRKKNYFKVLVLKDLVATGNFNLYTTYLINVASSFKHWCKVYVERHCKKKKEKGNTNLYNLAELNLNATVIKIVEAIKSLHAQYSTETPDIGDTASSISDEDVCPSDKSAQILAMNDWLESFH